MGDIIGLAANVDSGKMAVSKNGSWSGDGFGVVFEDAKIKAGVYPALTAQGGVLRYQTFAPFRFAPPSASPELWLNA